MSKKESLLTKLPILNLYVARLFFTDMEGNVFVSEISVLYLKRYWLRLIWHS